MPIARDQNIVRAAVSATRTQLRVSWIHPRPLRHSKYRRYVKINFIAVDKPKREQLGHEREKVDTVGGGPNAGDSLKYTSRHTGSCMVSETYTSGC